MAQRGRLLIDSLVLRLWFECEVTPVAPGSDTWSLGGGTVGRLWPLGSHPPLLWSSCCLPVVGEEPAACSRCHELCCILSTKVDSVLSETSAKVGKVEKTYVPFTPATKNKTNKSPSNRTNQILG